MLPCQIYLATAQFKIIMLETISFPYIWHKVQLPRCVVGQETDFQVHHKLCYGIP